MKIKLLIILFLILIPKLSFAQDKYEWTTENTIMEASFLVLNTIDWGQTLDIAKNPDKFIETNLILGKHPTKNEINLYFLTWSILHPIIMYHLPKDYREISQFISISLSGQTIIQNFNLGLRINF